MRAPTPTNEDRRLAALLSCGVLDTPAESAFDDVAQLAGQLCATPIALVSLVDRERQWFKASVGFDQREMSRDLSFCAHAIASSGTLVVPDAQADARFADNPAVTGDPHIRFYAGVPLMIEEGVFVGTLCVIDRVPRELSREQLSALEALGRRVAHELRLRRSVEQWQRRRAPAAEPAGDARAVVGRLLMGRYRIEEVLGVGGMGIVVAARDEADGADVAIKFLHAEMRQRADVQERFVREARAALRVGGEQIAHVLDVGNLPGGAPFIVMERLHGEDLEAHLDAVGPLPVGEAVDVILQACVAVGRAHAAGVLHRDLKPANLFLSTRADGATLVKILDFGISKFSAVDEAAASPRLTDASEMLGSPVYMSPEQMKGAADVDGRTDVWALGVILYELLSGALPFDGDSFIEVCTAVMTRRPPPLRELRPEVPEALASVVERCLSKDRAARYPSIDALALALAPFAWRPFHPPSIPPVAAVESFIEPAIEPVAEPVAEPVIELVNRVVARPASVPAPAFVPPPAPPAVPPPTPLAVPPPTPLAAPAPVPARAALRASMLAGRPAWAVVLTLVLLLLAVVLIMTGAGAHG
jgi:serine/threonine protein kinase